MPIVANRAPGTYSERRTASPAGAAAPNTGTAFLVGTTRRGPIDQAVPVTSISGWRDTFGAAPSGSNLDDCVDVFFREGGSLLVGARNVGVGAVAAIAALSGTGVTLNAVAASPGTWGNALKLDVIVASGQYTIVVKDSSTTPVTELQRSAALTTREEAVTAFASSPYVRFTTGAGSGAPATATDVAFTTGADGAVSDATFSAALTLLTEDLGPGQVIAPGDTATTRHAALRAHAISNDRIAICDLADAVAGTSVASTLTARTDVGADTSALCASVAIAPGGPAGSNREIPYSVVLAAHAAASDRTKVPGKAIAGDNSVCRYVTGLKRTYTTAERQALNNAGATVAILDAPDSVGTRRVTTFSDRTVSDRADSSKVQELSDARVLMAVEARMRFAQRPFRFTDLVPKNVAALTGAQTNLGVDLYSEGVISDGQVDGTGVYKDAFSVDVTVDKPNRTFISTAYVRPSRCGEVMQVNVVRQLEN